MGRLVTGSDNVHSGSGLVNRIFSVLKQLNLQDLLLDMLRKLGMPFISKREKGPPGARMGSRRATLEALQAPCSWRRREELRVFFFGFSTSTTGPLCEFLCGKHCVLRERVVIN